MGTPTLRFVGWVTFRGWSRFAAQRGLRGIGRAQSTRPSTLVTRASNVKCKKKRKMPKCEHTRQIGSFISDQLKGKHPTPARRSLWTGVSRQVSSRALQCSLVTAAALRGFIFSRAIIQDFYWNKCDQENTRATPEAEAGRLQNQAA